MFQLLSIIDSKSYNYEISAPLNLKLINHILQFYGDRISSEVIIEPRLRKGQLPGSIYAPNAKLKQPLEDHVKVIKHHTKRDAMIQETKYGKLDVGKSSYAPHSFSTERILSQVLLQHLTSQISLTGCFF